ncbi:hypothetical protein DFJ58DRAFT_907651 [Suillus subalutaceus]|uniref:uncharacterized protein n=1 Tax=Suillus subalutaceus TaxID=48586 RepID=UPI001B86DC1E|nr:uncharacterized protein DFJ58DRAFT_907651 [Suillus subalutaceus]KAG1841940.1 hypothetical protein DFJ58DRAFT_907651 [Suillus subalutaceus]
MKVAVVGSGVSSLATTWRIFAIRVLQTELTFRVCRDSDIFECAAKSSRLLDPDMWRLIYDVLGFSACARRLVSNKASSDDPDLSFLQLMTTTICSTPPEKCLINIPARTLVRFMSNHHLSQITGKPSCLTIEGGAIESDCIPYSQLLDAILSKLPQEKLHLSSPAKAVTTVLLKTHNPDAITVYDWVILACHSDARQFWKADAICADGEDVLKSFEWNMNVVVLHSDINVLDAKARNACSNDKGKHKANINKLQHLPKDLHGPVLATLNPPTDSNVTKPAARFAYERPHPQQQAIIARKAMTNIQGRGGVLFAGAWLGYGFHEDGFTSDLRAVLSFDGAGADREPCVPLFAPLFGSLEITGICAVVGTALTLALLIVQS